MEFESYFPIWSRLTAAQQERILGGLTERRVKKGTVLHSGAGECLGLLLVKSGQLRAYILSDEGREVTVYRLFERDLCLFSASCILRGVQFDITIEAEKDTAFWVIPAELYRRLLEESAPAANYTNEIMAARFSEVMWRMEQILWKRLDMRVASFLLEESAIEGGSRLKLTHETIANHLGTHREVITRMLRYFQGEGMIRLSRGSVELLDEAGLEALRDA
ncbi:MAG: Crp/Fnr family transcriptional regulator [Oscillibacter sp.]|nr:Crp/Fnr family transcriptional regulator [uncultured Oscillibacter sp.]MCI8969945.1 Crp/Fnr family transcriptional regulator [Oscillibacter sp.]